MAMRRRGKPGEHKMFRVPNPTDISDVATRVENSLDFGFDDHMQDHEPLPVAMVRLGR